MSLINMFDWKPTALTNALFTVVAVTIILVYWLHLLAEFEFISEDSCKRIQL